MRASFTAGAAALAVVAALATPTAQAVEPGAAAPAIELPAPGSGRISLAQYRGKLVWLDFWASWCGPCKQSFPWMNALQDKYGPAGLQVLAVNVDARAADAEKFLAEHPARFALGFDPAGATPRSYQIKGMPTSVLIGPDGRVLKVHSGFRESEVAELEQQIRTALERQPGSRP